MSPAEIKELQREKLDWEFRGTGGDRIEREVNKIPLSKVQIEGMKDEVRTAVNKAYAKDIGNFDKTESIRFIFNCVCAEYLNGETTLTNLREEYRKALNQLNEL